MSDFDKYRRLKLISYLLIATRRDGKKEDAPSEDEEDPKREDGERERVVLYENNRLIVVILIVLFADLLKNCYFFYMPMTLNDRLLYGDIIISLQEDQRLYNFVLIVVYISTFVYYYFLLFGKQKASFYRLSKFLYVLNPWVYSRRLLVTNEFAERASRWLDRGVLVNQMVIVNYLIFTSSFYAKTLYKAISLGFSWKQILLYTCPSILVGAFTLINFYRIAVQAYIFFILYIRVMNAKLNRLTADLNKLDDRPSNRRKLFRHLADLDSVVSEYKVSKDFFENSLVLAVPPVLITIALFPTNIMFSENLMTNQIVLMFFVNLFFVLIPILNSNELFKRAFALYLNSIHRFMARTRNAKGKLKLMKILDISQKDSPVSYSLFGGLFDLEMEAAPTILAESFAISFLIFPLIYYAQS